jgi:2-polyprenyl-3-methyl-5-hydroxy-6-metoxy-1,4-benzoquinol methylase
MHARPDSGALPASSIGVDQEAFADRMLHAALGFADLVAIYLGDRLGWYRALAAGPATAAELAQRAGGAERYAHEWLEQQAASGILSVGADGRFVLPAAARKALAEPDGESYRTPLARVFVAAVAQLPAIADAYVTGEGVSWGQYGDAMRNAQAAITRPWYLHRLAAMLATVPDLDATLGRPGARVADVGCGAGWSSMALAKAYPDASVEGWDVDAPSVAMASELARAMGLDGRIAFRSCDAAQLPGSSYDGVFAFECVHDLSDPVSVLAAMRRAVLPGGVVLVLDEAVADAFRLPVADSERLAYAFSLLACLPAGMSAEPSAGTGAVMRESTLRGYAIRAGFAGVDVVSEEPGGFRLYRLTTGSLEA